MIQLFSILYFNFMVINGQVLSVNQPGPAQVSIKDQGKAKIDLQKEANKITVRGLFVDGTVSDQPYTYKLTVNKTGRGGSSNNAQSGQFEIAPGQKEVVLSAAGFNANSHDNFDIQLQVYKGTELISQDVLVIDIP